MRPRIGIAKMVTKYGRTINLPEFAGEKPNLSSNCRVPMAVCVNNMEYVIKLSMFMSQNAASNFNKFQTLCYSLV